MTSVQFCYWLQGFFELSGDERIEFTASQVDLVKRHLSLVFVHDIDPAAGGPETQAVLNEIHNPPRPKPPRPKVPDQVPPNMMIRC